MSVHQLARPVERPGATPPWAKFLSAAITPEWRPGEWDDATSVFTGSIGQPLSLVSQCLTPECRTLVDSPQARCIRCRRARSASTSKHEFEQEYCPPAPKPRGARQLGIHQFSLAGLQPSVRDEVLYGLQQRDLQATGVRPSTVSRLVNRIGPAVQSILDVDLPDLVAVQAGMLRSLQLHVRRLRSLHVGDDGTRGEIWDAALVGLRSAPNRPYIAAFGRLDFTPIRQEWLRRVVMELARAHRPSAQEVHRDIAVATLASAALTGRPHGNDPTGLGRADMAAVFAAINASRSPRTGRVYSVTHRISNLGRWQRLMSTARTSGLMDDVPGTFALGPGDHIAPEQITEEQLGRAVPDSWIRHLDDHLSLLGSSTAFAWGEWSATDFALMYQTIYQLIRDTGRVRTRSSAWRPTRSSPGPDSRSWSMTITRPVASAVDCPSTRRPRASCNGGSSTGPPCPWRRSAGSGCSPPRACAAGPGGHTCHRTCSASTSWPGCSSCHHRQQGTVMTRRRERCSARSSRMGSGTPTPNVTPTAAPRSTCCAS